MSRGLPTVFAVLFLAFAAVAASAGPDDIFDARALGALEPGQKAVILSLEGGRYLFADGHFSDTRAADPARPLLTKARVAELLARPAAGAPADEKTAPGAIGADAAYERALARAPKGAPGPMNFDGDGARAAGIRGPPPAGQARGSGQPAPAGSIASPDPAILQAQLLQRVAFTGTKPEREAFGEAVTLILKTKSGSALARQFVNERAEADVIIAVTANAGSTDTDSVPPKITIDKQYTVGGKDPDYSRVVMAGTLAHELFGHALEAQRAKKAGFSSLAFYHYRGDEVGARLIDWSVQTELAGKVADADPQEFLGDQEAYYRGLLTRDPYYVVSLSAKEMKQPLTTLVGRRKLLAADKAKTEAAMKETASWRPVIAHFVGIHRLDKTRFEPAEKEIDDYLKWAEGHQMKLAESRANLETHIATWSSPAGADERKTLSAAADSAYLRNWDEELQKRAKDLIALRAGGGARGPAAIEMPVVVVTAPRPGGPPIDLAELARMYEKDKTANPRHFR
jgi:hypothetical protein